MRAGARMLVLMDLLSAVLRELRFESAGYRWLELGAPFRICFDQPGLRGVHLVARGECELVLHDGSVDRLTAGDLVIFPRSDAHVLRSPGAGAGSTVSSADLAAQTPGIRLRAGGPRADVVIVCGAFLVGEPDHPALRGLPRCIHLPGNAGRPQPWLTPLVEVLRAEAFDGGPGSDLVMARLSDALLIRVLRHHSDTVAHTGWLAGLRDPFVAAALAAVHTNLAHPWTLASLPARSDCPGQHSPPDSPTASANQPCATCCLCGCNAPKHCYETRTRPSPRSPPRSDTTPTLLLPPHSNVRSAAPQAPTAGQ